MLLADKSPCKWSGANGAIRAAQIIALAGQCGHPTAQTSEALAARAVYIAHGFLKDMPMRQAPAEYISRVLEDWRAHTQRT